MWRVVWPRLLTMRLVTAHAARPLPAGPDAIHVTETPRLSRVPCRGCDSPSCVTVPAASWGMFLTTERPVRRHPPAREPLASCLSAQLCTFLTFHTNGIMGHVTSVTASFTWCQAFQIPACCPCSVCTSLLCVAGVWSVCGQAPWTWWCRHAVSVATSRGVS